MCGGSGRGVWGWVGHFGPEAQNLDMPVYDFLLTPELLSKWFLLGWFQCSVAFRIQHVRQSKRDAGNQERKGVLEKCVCGIPQIYVACIQ